MKLWTLSLSFSLSHSLYFFLYSLPSLWMKWFVSRKATQKFYKCINHPHKSGFFPEGNTKEEMARGDKHFFALWNIIPAWSFTLFPFLFRFVFSRVRSMNRLIFKIRSSRRRMIPSRISRAPKSKRSLCTSRFTFANTTWLGCGTMRIERRKRV